MNGWSLFATIFGGFASLLTIIVLLAQLSSTAALLARDVSDNKQLLESRTETIDNMESQLSELVIFSNDIATVEYLSDTELVLRAPVRYNGKLITIQLKAPKVMGEKSEG